MKVGKSLRERLTRAVCRYPGPCLPVRDLQRKMKGVLSENLKREFTKLTYLLYYFHFKLNKIRCSRDSIPRPTSIMKSYETMSNINAVKITATACNGDICYLINILPPDVNIIPLFNKYAVKRIIDFNRPLLHVLITIFLTSIPDNSCVGRGFFDCT